MLCLTGVHTAVAKLNNLLCCNTTTGKIHISTLFIKFWELLGKFKIFWHCEYCSQIEFSGLLAREHLRRREKRRGRGEKESNINKIMQRNTEIQNREIQKNGM